MNWRWPLSRFGKHMHADVKMSSAYTRGYKLDKLSSCLDIGIVGLLPGLVKYSCFKLAVSRVGLSRNSVLQIKCVVKLPTEINASLDEMSTNMNQHFSYWDFDKLDLQKIFYYHTDFAHIKVFISPTPTILCAIPCTMEKIWSRRSLIWKIWTGMSFMDLRTSVASSWDRVNSSE